MSKKNKKKKKSKKNNLPEINLDLNSQDIGIIVVGAIGAIIATIVGIIVLYDNQLPVDVENNEDEKSNENKNSTQKKIDYNILSECVLLQQLDKTNQTEKYFAAKKIQDVKQEEDSAILTFSYINVKDNSKIVEFNTKDSNLDNLNYSYTEIGSLSNYIFDYNYVQTEYENKDIDNLINKIVNDLQNQKQNSFTLKQNY